MAKQRIAPDPNVGRNITALMQKNEALSSQPKIAARTGLAQSTVGRTIRGDSNASSHNLKLIAEAFGVDVDTLFLDEDAFARALNVPQAQKSANVLELMGAVPLRATRNVPVVGTTQGGPPDRIWLETGHPVGHSDLFLEVATSDPHAYGLRVVGDSMAPRIMEGEWIVIEPSVECHPGDEVVVRTLEGEVMVKVFAAKHEDTIYLDSVNQSFKRITKTLAELDFMHYVAGRFPPRSVKKRMEIANYGGPFRRTHDEPVSIERRASAVKVSGEGTDQAADEPSRHKDWGTW